MRPTFVARNNIEQVIDGFRRYYEHMIQVQQFNAVEMKNFMEPIFEHTGYRQYHTENNLGGGWLDSQINILLIHDSGVGDFVIKSPAIKEVRRLYPTAHITLVFFPRALTLAEYCPYVDEVIPNGRECDWHSLPEIYRWNAGIAQRLLRRRIDIVYAFTQYPSTILLSYMSGAKERISHKFTPEDGAIECAPFYIFSSLLTIEVPKQYYGTHSVDHNLSLLDYTLHAPVADRELEVWYTPFDRAEAENIVSADGRKTYALCMGGTAPQRQWAPQRYAELVAQILRKESDAKFIILGGGPNDEMSAAIFRQSIDEKMFSERVIDLTGKTNYRQSAALLSLCDMYIGSNTGTMHIAAAVQTPVLSLHCCAADLKIKFPDHIAYCPYHVPTITVQPKHALPECQGSDSGRGCRIVDRPHCITQITVNTVFDAFNKLKKRVATNNLKPLFIS